MNADAFKVDGPSLRQNGTSKPCKFNGLQGFCFFWPIKWPIIGQCFAAGQ
jgi:hypothetical protein